MFSVLNVGGSNKSIPIPPHFDGWRHDLLDIDPILKPDLLADARELEKFPPATYDAVYCSHNLEHFYHHDAFKVARGFHHILKPTGFAEIHVPDVLAVMRKLVQDNLDVEDVLFEAPAGPVTACDVLYGLRVQIEKSGKDFFAHKTCFSIKSLVAFMAKSGFPYSCSRTGFYEVIGVFFKQPPSDELRRLLHIAD